MTGYVAIEGGPISVGEAISRFGPASVPAFARDEPLYHLVTHVAEDGRWCLAALNARYFRERTNWRLVRDERGRVRLLYCCPQDGELIEHIHEHWTEEGTHKRGTTR